MAKNKKVTAEEFDERIDQRAAEMEAVFKARLSNQNSGGETDGE